MKTVQLNEINDLWQTMLSMNLCGKILSKMKRQLTYTLLSVLSLLATGCINDKYPECPPSVSEEALNLRLNFTVPASASSSDTRAENHDRVPGTDVTDVENYINVKDKDFKILIFGKDETLVKEIEGNDELCEIHSETSDGTKYTLTFNLKITDSKTKENLQKFKVMVLANWKSCDITENFRYPSFEGYDISEGEKSIYKEESRFNFTIYDTNNTKDTWKPDSKTNRYIPMFGISEEIDWDYALMMGKYGDGYSTDSPIKMLRGLAKIEIVDVTVNQNLQVEGFSHCIWGGRMIPNLLDNPSWDIDATQIEKPSATSPAALSATRQPEDKRFEFHDGGKNQDGHMWYYYLPETELGTGDGLPRPDIGFTYNGKSYNMSLDNNIDKNGSGDGTLKSILRNHIYRYTIDVNQAQLKVGFSVLPWDMEWDDTPTHFDEPEVAEDGYITWVTKVFDDPDDPDSERENGYKDNSEDLIFTMKPSTDEYAECSFTLSAPIKAKWNAYLRRTSGEFDAFYFTTGDKRENPSEEESYFIEGGNSGIINGEPITLKIACRRGVVNDESNEALLVIMVQYPDKTQKEVIVVDPSKEPDTVISKPYTNYTIVQTVTNIM